MRTERTTRRVKNVLFFVADQWRGDTLGIYGHGQVSTPNIDALAADGLLFRRHFTQASPCGPARASMLTGLYMFNHGQVGNGTPLSATLPNLASAIAATGTEAALFGYTDTPYDPRHHVPDDDVGDPSRWVCPGFTVVEPFLISQGAQNWRTYLDAQGIELPPGFRRLYLPATDGESSRATDYRNFAPSRFDAEHSDTHFLTDAAIDYIRKRGETPWFVHLACLRPHPPMVAPSPYHDRYDPRSIEPPARPLSFSDTASLHPLNQAYLEQQDLKEYFGRHLRADEISERLDQQMRATYYGNCSEVDDNLGRVIDWLKRNDQYDETLIVFCSDHGDQLGDHWLYGRRGFYDAHFHVPLVVRDPRREADATRGHHIEAFTEHVDLMDTICEALDIELPDERDGRSLLPYLHSATSRHHGTTTREFTHYEWDFRDYPSRSIAKALGLADTACTMAVIQDLRFKYIHFPSLPPVLFDLGNDPQQTVNLAADPGYARTTAQYARELLTVRMQHTRHPFSDYNQIYGGRLEKLL